MDPTLPQNKPDSPLEGNFKMEKLRTTLPVDAVLSRSQSTYSIGGREGSGYREHSSRSVTGSSTSRAIRRSTSTASRHRSSLASSYRNSMATENTAQVEAKFFAFIEMISNASREAASLKELWSQMAAERRNFSAEREELREQIEEITYELETKNNFDSRNDNELGEHKEKLRTLSIELTTAINSLSSEKIKISERDQHINRLRNELISQQELGANFRAQVDRLKSDYQSNESLLRATLNERDGIKEDAERSQHDLLKVTQERTEFSTRLDEVTINLETLRKEASVSAERLRRSDIDKEETVLEISRLKEELRKSRTREQESAQELLVVSDKSGHSNREISKLKDTLRTVEGERDELIFTVEAKGRDLKATIAERDENQDLLVEKTSVLDLLRRDLSLVEDKLASVELDRDEKLQALEHSREQHKLVIISRDDLQSELSTARGKIDAGRRQINLLTEAIQKTEQIVIDARAEMTFLNGAIKTLEREKLDWQAKNTGVSDQLIELKGRIVILQNEIHAAGGEREALHDELRRSREELEEVTETITHDDSAEFEFELESMRTMVREAREQKEQAIAARTAADRERDDAYSKYEEKCRELERFEENATARLHAQSSSSSSGARTSTTTTRKSRVSGGSSVMHSE